MKNERSGKKRKGAKPSDDTIARLGSTYHAWVAVHPDAGTAFQQALVELLGDAGVNFDRVDVRIKSWPSLKAKARKQREDRGDRGPRAPRSREGMRTYRLAVGRNERVQPGGIVGALANEGGLTSGQIGHIDIRSNHSLVDLPDDLPQTVFDRLANTRVQGKRIDLRPDTGRPGRPFKKKSFDKQPGEGRKFRQEPGGRKGFYRGGKGPGR